MLRVMVTGIINQVSDLRLNYYECILCLKIPVRVQDMRFLCDHIMHYILNWYNNKRSVNPSYISDDILEFKWFILSTCAYTEEMYHINTA